MSHSFSVAFRFHADHISPEAMTERIGIEPTDVRRVGDKHLPWRPDGPENQWSSNMWVYDPDYDRSRSLEDQLKSLLVELAPEKERIQHLAREATAVFYCACFSSDHPETMTELSPETLAEMASYGAMFSLSHYLCSEDDDEDDDDDDDDTD